MFNLAASDVSYRQTFLGHIGCHLHILKLFDCSNIDPIAELLPCTQLEDLEFKMSSLIPRPSYCIIDADQFLPSLQKLETSNTCLGDWSSLFECHRPLLTHLSFSCSHIGIASKSPLFDWHNIAEMWPNVQSLAFKNVFNLTVDKLSVIITQNLLNKLEGPLILTLAFIQQSIEEIGAEETREKVFLLRKNLGRLFNSRVVFVKVTETCQCPFIIHSNPIVFTPNPVYFQ